jgi:hypothetical protein
LVNDDNDDRDYMFNTHSTRVRLVPLLAFQTFEGSESRVLLTTSARRVADDGRREDAVFPDATAA